MDDGKRMAGIMHRGSNAGDKFRAAARQAASEMRVEACPLGLTIFKPGSLVKLGGHKFKVKRVKLPGRVDLASAEEADRRLPVIGAGFKLGGHSFKCVEHRKNLAVLKLVKEG